MKRYFDYGGMREHDDGEWIRYSDHVEAMRRVWDGGQSLQRAIDRAPSAAPVAQADNEPCSFCFQFDCNGECSGDGAMGD